MTDRGSSRSIIRRPAHTAGRLFLCAIGVILAIPLWLFWFLAILLLPLSRPFVLVPLGLCVAGGFAAGVYFAHGHAWGDAIQAFGIGIGAAVFLAAFTALAEKIDPDFSRPTPWPPWWWYF